MRILLIEDDTDLSATLLLSLDREGYAADLCCDGEEGLLLAKEDFYDIIILDRMLPGLDGLTLLKKIRDAGCRTPVLMLTALGRISDRVDGFEAGADDYLTKPFDTRELLARVKALLRRPKDTLAAADVAYGDLKLDTRELMLTGPAKKLKLSPKECLLLESLLKTPETLLSRDYLIGCVWGANDIVEDANLDTYICFLRRRLKNTKSSIAIETVRCSGYRLTVRS